MSSDESSATTVTVRTPQRSLPRLSTTVLPFLRAHYAWVLAVCCAYWILLFTLTHLPSDRLPAKPLLGDKLYHTLAYAGLTWLLALCYRLRFRMTLSAALAIVLVGGLYGAVDELSQQFVRGRLCDLHDWMADVTGAVLGVVTLEAVNALRPRLRRLLG